MEVYAAQIDRMDQNVGRILDALRAAGRRTGHADPVPGRQRRLRRRSARRAAGPYSVPKQTRDGRPMRPGNVPSIMPGGEDTFPSYGTGWANASNTPFRRYKHWVHEGGISTPLIARWPRRHRAAATRSLTNRATHRPDGDLRGRRRARSIPRSTPASAILPMEGPQPAPRVRRQDDPARRCHSTGSTKAIAPCSTGKWKLVSRFPDRWELYDLEADRSELHDLAAQDPTASRACPHSTTAGPPGPTWSPGSV